MGEIGRFRAAGRAIALACGLTILVVGCGGEQGGSSESVAKAQETASSQWAKEKAEHPKSDRSTGKAKQPSPKGSRGAIN